MKDNISNLEKLVKEFCEERDWDQFHNPKDLSIGISTEANELLELFRFKSRKDIKHIMNNKNEKEKVENELADIMFFILRFAQMNDIDLEKILKRKVKINNKKYPKDLARGSNKKYNEFNLEKNS